MKSTKIITVSYQGAPDAAKEAAIINQAVRLDGIEIAAVSGVDTNNPSTGRRELTFQFAKTRHALKFVRWAAGEQDFEVRS